MSPEKAGAPARRPGPPRRDLSFANGPWVNACNRYGVYALRRDILHRPAARLVLEGQVYEPGTIEFIRNRCGRGDVVHAGTFFGDFLPGIAAALAPGALIWAFEPNPANFALAGETARLNRLENVLLHNAALSDAGGPRVLVARNPSGGSLGGGSHLVEGASAAADQTEEVDALRIDDVVPADRPVSIVQLDVEGHEVPALRGARHTIARCRPILILERLEDPEALAALFPGLGYRPVGRLHGNVVYCA
jgi:FkbM family methyltransferase